MVITTTQLHSTKPERRFKPCSRRVGVSRWWESLTMVPAGNKAKGVSSVNHTTKNNSSIHVWRYFWCCFDVSLFLRQKLCVFISACPFSLLKLLISFGLNMMFNGGLKIFTETFFLLLLYFRKDQVQKQYGCKIWFCCNRQKNDYLIW